MKIKMLFVALAMLAVASVSQAQFNAVLYNFGPQFLTSSCDGGDPLAATCVVKIYWDANNNGPDAADAQPAVGNGFGQCNFNQFSMQSGYDFGAPGGFYPEDAFTISTTTPTPSQYYLRCECGSVRWTSRVFTVVNGPADYDLGTGWTCEVTSVPCTAPNFVGINTVGGRNFLHNGPYYQCIDLCAGQTTQICLGPLAADERPHVSIIPGCFHPGAPGCDVQCPPAQFGYDPAGWTYNAANGSWCNVIVGGSDGCACLGLEFIEGAVDVDLSAVAGDSKVDVVWSPAAETNLSSYQVMRRAMGHEFEMLASVSATNSATYKYSDESAENGTAYEYTLNMVDVNGSVSALGTVASATPSVDAAVITEYALHQNYPNPFNPNTSLVYDVVAENHVNLTVYNAMGQSVATLVNGTVGAGRHTVNFDASNLTSGLYFYTVKIGNEFTATKKMLLIK